MAYVYMVRCRNGSLYTGWTNDLQKRLIAHQSGKGAAYTRGFDAQTLAYAEALPDKSAALRREAALKKYSKAEKEALCAGFDPRQFVLLRPARPADAADVRRIADHYIQHSTACFLYQTPTEETYRQQIRQNMKRYPYLVAHDALGNPLGYACAHTWETGLGAYSWDAETTIYLAPETRRKGVGRMLYQAMLATLALQGYWNVYAVLADPNPDSERFHAAMGFVCEGRQAHTGYKNGWQGVSFWGLALRTGDEMPEKLPDPLPKQALAAAAEAARMGDDWQTILQALQTTDPRGEKHIDTIQSV